MISFKRVFKLIVDILTCILIFVVALYLVVVIYNKFINKSDKFLIGKYYIFQIITGSMEHELVAGDYIVVLKTDNYKVGDIVTYMEDGCYITHRINKMDGDSVITKGDANNSEDSPISRNKIVGKFLFKAKILTFLIKYRVMVIAILIALIILESGFNKSDNNLGNNKKKDKIIEISDKEERDIPIKKENN